MKYIYPVIKDRNKVVGIPIKVLTKVRTIPFAVYVKINDQKFVLVSDADKSTPLNLIEKFEKRGLENFYILLKDKEHILKSSCKTEHILDKIEEISPETKAKNKIQERADELKLETKAVLTEINAVGLNKITPKLAKSSQQISEGIVNLIVKDINILEDFLILKNVSDYFWARSVASSAFMGAFLQFLKHDVILEGVSSPENIRDASLAAFLHDIGNKFIDPKILLKPTKLSASEFSEIKKHPQHSCKIVESMKGMNKFIYDIILQHHEYYNGHGYPNGLKGKNICLHARILTIIDSFTAMLMKSPYSEGYSVEKTLEIMFSETGKFDEVLLMKFFEMFKDKISFTKI